MLSVAGEHNRTCVRKRAQRITRYRTFRRLDKNAVQIFNGKTMLFFTPYNKLSVIYPDTARGR